MDSRARAPLHATVEHPPSRCGYRERSPRWPRRSLPARAQQVVGGAQDSYHSDRRNVRAILVGLALVLLTGCSAPPPTPTAPPSPSATLPPPPTPRSSPTAAVSAPTSTTARAATSLPTAAPTSTLRAPPPLLPTNTALPLPTAKPGTPTPISRPVRTPASKPDRRRPSRRPPSPSRPSRSRRPLPRSRPPGRSSPPRSRAILVPTPGAAASGEVHQHPLAGQLPSARVWDGRSGCGGDGRSSPPSRT